MNHHNVEEVTQAKTSDSLAICAIVAIVIVTVIVIRQESITTPVLVGISFITALGSLVILILSGFLHAVITNGQRERTKRELYRLQYYFQTAQQPSLHVVEPEQLPYREPVAALPTEPSYVPAVPPKPTNIKISAAGWVAQLFDPDTGRALSKAITPNVGQIQVKSPSQDVLQYLLGLRMVIKGKGAQLYWNQEDYSTLQEAVNAIRRGRHPGSWEEGEGRRVEEALVGEMVR